MKNQELAQRLEAIIANSMTPVQDYSEENIRQHWKYRDRNDIDNEQQRIMYVAGYLAGRSVESSNLREALRGLLREVCPNNGVNADPEGRA